MVEQARKVGFRGAGKEMCVCVCCIYDCVCVCVFVRATLSHQECGLSLMYICDSLFEC